MYIASVTRIFSAAFHFVLSAVLYVQIAFLPSNARIIFELKLLTHKDHPETKDIYIGLCGLLVCCFYLATVEAK